MTDAILVLNAGSSSIKFSLFQGEQRPTRQDQARLNLRTMVLRDYGKPVGIPTLIDAPHAGQPR